MATPPFTAVELARLPAPDLIETLDFNVLLAEAVGVMQREMPDFEARPADPVMKLLRLFAMECLRLRQRINEAAEAVMPAYASGADLDQIAALFGIRRFEIRPADPQRGLAAEMESDEDFRRRMVIAPEGYSVAGPEGAYIFHALSAHANVLDASATSPAAGEVLVSILSRLGDGRANASLIARVQEYLSAEERRPLTDFVTVQSAEIIHFEIKANITTFSGPDSAVVLGVSRARLDQYLAESRRMGRDVTRSAIISALHSEGVHNVELLSPAADIVISRTQAPYCAAVSIQHLGIGE